MTLPSSIIAVGVVSGSASDLDEFVVRHVLGSINVERLSQQCMNTSHLPQVRKIRGRKHRSYFCSAVLLKCIEHNGLPFVMHYINKWKY